MIDKICIFHCIGLYSSYKDLLIIPSVISQLLSPFALVNQATYFMDRIQKEKKKSPLRFIPIVCLFDSGHFFSRVAVKKAKTLILLLLGIAFGTILLLCAFCQI
jgi:hypothetical protein